MNGNDVGAEDPSQAADMGIVEEEEVKVDPSATALGAAVRTLWLNTRVPAKDMKQTVEGKLMYCVSCYVKRMAFLW